MLATQQRLLARRLSSVATTTATPSRALLLLRCSSSKRSVFAVGPQRTPTAAVVCFQPRRGIATGPNGQRRGMMSAMAEVEEETADDFGTQGIYPHTYPTYPGR